MSMSHTAFRARSPRALAVAVRALGGILLAALAIAMPAGAQFDDLIGGGGFGDPFGDAGPSTFKG